MSQRKKRDSIQFEVPDDTILNDAALCELFGEGDKVTTDWVYRNFTQRGCIGVTIGEQEFRLWSWIRTWMEARRTTEGPQTCPSNNNQPNAAGEGERPSSTE